MGSIGTAPSRQRWTGNNKRLFIWEALSAVVRGMGRAVPGQTPVVLVVEDESLVRLNAVDMIEASGFEALQAADADEAIEILESRNDIRAVFTDVQMLGSIDGLRLARVVRDRWPPVALIVTSGQSNIAPSDLPSGGKFLSKPYQPRQLEAALRQSIEAREACGTAKQSRT